METSLWTLIAHWIVSAFALALTAFLIPGFRIQGFGTAMVASFVIGLANILIRPILIFLTLPLTILTLGLFLVIVDAIVLRICAGILKNFEITNWLSAIAGAILLAITSGVLHYWLI